MEAPKPEMGDDDEILNHVALECMHAMQNKDKSAFLDALKCLILSIESQEEPESKEE